MSKPRRQPDPPVLSYRYHSPNIPISAIRRFARQIADKFHPDRIILFGSYAYGTPHEWSDVDLLVVVPAYNEINQAIRIELAFEEPFPVDLIVRTPEKLQRRIQDGDWFLREIISKGKVLYDKRDTSLGQKSRARFGRGDKPRTNTSTRK
jgi:predicted nucleotidyltransferase